VQLLTPGQSSDNWLARSRVTDEQFQRAARILAKEDVSQLGIKSYALGLSEKSCDPFNQRHNIQMTDAANKGVYTASVGQTSPPGTYEFYVTAVGQTYDGITFRREKRLQVRVGVRPEPAFTLFEIDYAPIVAGRPAIATVLVPPLDRFGNVYLRDLASNPSLDLSVKGGEFTGALVSRLDGSYTRQLAYTPGNTPVINLVVDGQQVGADQPVELPTDLSYADRVLEFKAGDEAAPGAK
jgi:hypothetical protein